jgi:peptidoglycan-associated lipoprotein
MSKRVCSVVLAAVLVVTGLTGCSRKPKLDLSGLRNPPGGGGEGVAGAFNPLDGAGGDGAGAFGAGAGGAGADGKWAGMDSPLGGGGGAGTNINAINEPWAQVVVYFGFDSAALDNAEMPKLEALAGHLREHADYIAVVEGHCDDRGSDEYNRALGENRALVVRDHLISLGIEAGRLETVSYGEERPAVAGATGETQHAKNRRAQFVVGTRK